MRIWTAALSLILLSANVAVAGDTFEGYLWIIASEKAKPAKTYSNSDFLTEVQSLKERYEARCGVKVQVWHSDLIDQFRPGLWVIYTVLEEERSKALAEVGEDGCSKKGYLKHGAVKYPRFLQACAANLEDCKKDGIGPGRITLGSGIAD